MVKQMNKHGFVQEISKQTNRDIRESIIIADCFDNHFIIGKKNKEKTILDIQNKLEIDYEEASEVYNIVSNIIATAIKNKLKHPFRSNE